MLDEDPDLDFARIEPNDSHQTSLRADEREVSVKYVEIWLDENDPDTGYLVLYTEEIVESAMDGDQPGEIISSDT